jgi:endonuclease YncB( thermonuclease family)
VAGAQEVRAVAALVLLIVLGGARPAVWVIDGDTVDVRGERVRVANLDAPDVGSHARCALEERRGQAAKAYAIQLVRSGEVIGLTDRQGRDRYGRSLARITVDGADFAGLMIAAGHGRPWRGRSSDWCSS